MIVHQDHRRRVPTNRVFHRQTHIGDALIQTAARLFNRGEQTIFRVQIATVKHFLRQIPQLRQKIPRDRIRIGKIAARLRFTLRQTFPQFNRRAESRRFADADAFDRQQIPPME